MYAKFIALTLATTLALTSVDARPAIAGNNNDEIARWLASLATLAIIGAAISERDDNRSKNNRKVKRHQGGSNLHKPSNGRFLLPAQCRRTGNLQGNTVRGFPAHCLQRRGVNVQALPRQCAVRFLDRSRDRRVTYYTAPCLRQFGYRLARY